MPHSNDVVELRQRMIEAQKAGLFSGQQDAAMAQAILLELLNDAERARQSHLTAAERARNHAIAEENQAKGISMVSSMVFSVLNGYLSKAAQDVEELKDLAEQEKD